MESFENIEISPQIIHVTNVYKNFISRILKVEETCLYVLQDLKHICTASGIGAQIELDKIPTSLSVTPSISDINSGDDYEICFTSSPKNESFIKEISEELGIPITSIGKTNDSTTISVIDKEGHEVPVESGYTHF